MDGEVEKRLALLGGLDAVMGESWPNGLSCLLAQATAPWQRHGAESLH